MDMLKGAALIAAFIGFLTIFAMWVSLWDNVWRASVEPVRGAIYDTRLNSDLPECILIEVRVEPRASALTVSSPHSSLHG